MKETILDVLMFMFQSYVEDNDEVELDKESLHKNLSEAGFADHNIERAFEWLEGLPGVDDSSLLISPQKIVLDYTVMLSIEKLEKRD